MCFFGAPQKPNAGLCLWAAEAVALKQRFDVLLGSMLHLTDDQGQVQRVQRVNSHGLLSTFEKLLILYGFQESG